LARALAGVEIDRAAAEPMHAVAVRARRPSATLAGVPTEAAPILIVDDHRAVREELAFALGYDGFRTIEAPDGPAALQALEGPATPALVILDVKLPGLDGLEVLARIKEQRPETPIIMISGHGDLDTAVLAVRRGAYDFLQKPFTNERVLLSVRNALRSASLARENEGLRAELARDQQLLGGSAAMQQVRALIAKVAPTDVAVLVTGENGTGKELVARQLHLLSRRSRAPFVAINCAAIPAELVESELFGHERGAFTGASAARAGSFEQADGGTLFLDEIGDMPLAMQPKLLRALQERLVQRLGAQQPHSVDVRVVAATNQDLSQMVAEREFREDLFYRLHVVRVHLPPLRERPGDVDELAVHFLRAACARNGTERRRLSPGALEWLRGQPWPGNVRQLKNVLEGAAVLADGPVVEALDLAAIAVPAPPRDAGAATDWFAFATLDEFRAATEKEFIRRKILENNGNIKRTAQRIDLQRSNLYKKLDRYGLK
jgi:two-component system nitrogen regulation response regulator NtrX